MKSPPAPAVREQETGPSVAPDTGAVPTWLIVVLVGAPTVLILLIMSGILGVIGSGSLIRFPQILVANTPTGGDMGAHVLLPQVLRDVLLPSGRIFGWSSTWYAGFPALYFYFPIPALVTVLLDVLLPYGVAFKLVAIVGLVGLPIATYGFVRLLGFSRPVSGLASLTGSMFVLMESFSIFGANIKSTLAGEFSFSWSFALSLLYLGVVARDTRPRKAVHAARRDAARSDGDDAHRHNDDRCRGLRGAAVQEERAAHGRLIVGPRVCDQCLLGATARDSRADRHDHRHGLGAGEEHRWRRHPGIAVPR